MTCGICSQPSDLFATAQALRRYDVRYYRCRSCGFVQTETPYWLDEAYSEPIANADIGLVSRNLSLATVARAVIPAFFNPDGKFLDYAGGYGLFVRLMRDAGFDFHRTDRYCPNLFAKAFEADLSVTQRYEVLTAFEVLEHLASPLDEIAHMLTLSHNILFTTLLVPPSNPKPDQWWYYAPESGQHVTFYTRASLSVLAERLGLHIYTDGTSIHLLTSKKIPDCLFKMVISSGRLTRLIARLMARRSLLPEDYLSVTGHQLG